jgi:hypothetical protein
VDSKFIGSDVDQLVLPCGAHELRVGGKSAARSVDVPCGGLLDLSGP